VINEVLFNILVTLFILVVLPNLPLIKSKTIFLSLSSNITYS